VEQPRLEYAAPNLLKRPADAVASKQGDRHLQKFRPGTVGPGEGAGRALLQIIDIALALCATTFAAGNPKYKSSCEGFLPLLGLSRAVICYGSSSFILP